jgi:hypothetical protein
LKLAPLFDLRLVGEIPFSLDMRDPDFDENPRPADQMMDSDDNDLGQRLADAGDEYVDDLIARLKRAVTVDDVYRVLCEGRDYFRDVILAFPVLIKATKKHARPSCVCFSTTV